MYQLINLSHQKLLQDLLTNIPRLEISDIVDRLEELIEQIRADIPEKKRISTGRYTIIKELGEEVFPLLEEAGIEQYGFSTKILNYPGVPNGSDPFVKSFAVGLIALYGLESGDLIRTLPVFEDAASDELWIVRECSSGLIRKLVKAYPEELRKWYLKMVKSKDPLQRRFVSESLRPVVENRWIHKEPEYALSIIKHLYKESKPYPRTSVGNNLSDWMRVDQDRAWKIVQKLADNGDENSYWIAYRACRNLVKTKPVEVMKLLGVEQYKYKSRIHYLKDHTEDL